MNPRFAGTFFYLALVNPRDLARALAAATVGPVVTTGWVLTEGGDALSAPPLRPI